MCECARMIDTTEMNCQATRILNSHMEIISDLIWSRQFQLAKKTNRAYQLETNILMIIFKKIQSLRWALGLSSKFRNVNNRIMLTLLSSCENE